MTGLKTIITALWSRFQMRTIVYSEDKRYYYIKELVCGHCNWISIKTFDEEPKEGWVSHSYQYDGSYFRSALPFAFWKVKSGTRERVRNNHDLVQDYQGCGHGKR